MNQIESRHPRLCTAKSSRTGKPCGRWAMKGQSICATRGGRSPQALTRAEKMVELAELKLRGLAGPAVATLEDLVTNASSEAVRLAAARDLVDRSVGRATERIQAAAAITVKRPSEPPRVSERLHVLGGWGLWDDRGSIHQRSGSERCDWCSIMSISTIRNGRRFGRWPRRSGALRRRCGTGCAKLSATSDDARV